MIKKLLEHCNFTLLPTAKVGLLGVSSPCPKYRWPLITTIDGLLQAVRC